MSPSGRNQDWFNAETPRQRTGGGSQRHPVDSVRHRRRRFHVPRQALGDGYETHGTVIPASAVNPVRVPPTIPDQHLTQTVPEHTTGTPLSEKEIARQTSRRGLWICLGVLTLLILGLQSKYVWAFYAVFARAWTDFLGGLPVR